VNFALAAYEKSPGWCSTDAIPGYPHIRKVHCMFGWDWGPRLPDAGVWRDIDLVCVDDARLDSVLVLQEHSAGKVTLNITPEISLGDAYPYRVAVKEGDPKGLLESINKSIAKMLDDGSMEMFISDANAMSVAALEG
jgi:beta-mannosidase